MKTELEHVNVTVKDPKQAAAVLVKLFGWKIRWQGKAKSGGFTVHVGSAGSYLALYSPPSDTEERLEPGHVRGGLNHIAVVVDDLNEAVARIKAAGFEPMNHGDYTPGRRFYFYDGDGIEFEVVSYRQALSPMEGACLSK